MKSIKSIIASKSVRRLTWFPGPSSVVCRGWERGPLYPSELDDAHLWTQPRPWSCRNVNRWTNGEQMVIFKQF
jgi:hypothetical protein